MKEGAKWQFCSSTHLPYAMADIIAFSAISPCPCPSDKLAKLFLTPYLSARFVISNLGSAPELKMKIKGVWQSESK